MARLLFVTSRLPYPPREGHQLRSWHLLKALAERHQVRLLSFLRKDDRLDEAGPLRDVLHSLDTFPIPSECSRVALGRALAKGVLTPQPFLAVKYESSALRARLATLACESDLVHFDMLPLMTYADCIPAGVPSVLNAHNIEHLLLATRAQIEPGLLRRTFLRGQVARLRAFEDAACRGVDAVLACSDADADGLRRLAPATKLVTVPNGVDLEANRPSVQANADPPQLVFVGQMGWFPNRDGVDWFLSEIFPRILAARPDVRFVLVGKGDGLVVPAGVSARVTLAGFVPDVRPPVHAASVYVVPLRAGSGTRLKVLEAMALGKAIVTTTIGSEGIALRHGHSALYADDADAFAAAVLELLESPSRAARLGSAARACAEAQYGWDAIGRDLLQHYDRLFADGALRRRAAA